VLVLTISIHFEDLCGKTYLARTHLVTCWLKHYVAKKARVCVFLWLQVHERNHIQS